MKFDLRDFSFPIHIAITRAFTRNLNIEAKTVLLDVCEGHLTTVNALLKGCAQIDVKIRHREPLEAGHQLIFTTLTKTPNGRLNLCRIISEGSIHSAGHKKTEQGQPNHLFHH